MVLATSSSSLVGHLQMECKWLLCVTSDLIGNGMLRVIRVIHKARRLGAENSLTNDLIGNQVINFLIRDAYVV